MRSFIDESGRERVATALEEATPRHHRRWHLAPHPPNQPEPVHTLREVRWQTRATAERTLRTMSEVELRRRLRIALDRAPGFAADPAPDAKSA
jgi:hypothetical protein